MSVLDKGLVRAINSGRSFMLVGSGASTAAGVPSWLALAEGAVGVAREAGAGERLLDKLSDTLKAGDYPAVFQSVSDLVGLDALCAHLSSLLDERRGLGAVYPLLASWPIATYLTTNFDDLLAEALRSRRHPYVIRENNERDMRELRADSEGMIFKLHGSLGRSQDLVLTSRQYHEFEKGPTREYWREIVFSLLRNVNVLIVGYSISDPNFAQQMEWAARLSAPNKPIYMFATGVGQEEIDRLFAAKNVRVIPYENPDGDHRELVRLLRRYDPFIATRESGNVGLTDVDEAQSALAGSLYVFTRSRVEADDETCLERTYCALVLSVLSDLELDARIPLTDLAARTSIAAKAAVDPRILQQAIERLHKSGYIRWDPQESSIALVVGGLERIHSTQQERHTVEERFDLSCRIFLEEADATLDPALFDGIITTLKRGIAAAFEQRGLEIAAAVYSDDTTQVSDATDILSVINRYGEGLASLPERAAFADLTIAVLLEPSKEMRSYLAAVSQGYFAYHTLGWDYGATHERLAMFTKTTWVVDSSVLLSRLAVGCGNHEYAVDLLKRMSDLGLNTIVTERLLYEIEGHARWAISEYVDKGIESIELLQAVMVSPGHRQNLFIDGYARWAVGRGAPRLADYMLECIGTHRLAGLQTQLTERLDELGVAVVQFDEWGYVVSNPEAYAERDDLQRSITGERVRRGTFKNEEQCLAEAEVLVIARHHEVSFLTQSNVLKGIAGIDRKVNWQPESFYRFLSLFSSVEPDSERLFESMTQTFYYCGFDIVDREAVGKYARGLAHQARLDLMKTRDAYSTALSEKDFDSLTEDFERVPDEEKPFYSMQFAHYVASAASAKAVAAERRADLLTAKAAMTEKEKAELERLRAEKQKRTDKAKKVSRRNQSRPKKKRKK